MILYKRVAVRSELVCETLTFENRYNANYRATLKKICDKFGLGAPSAPGELSVCAFKNGMVAGRAYLHQSPFGSYLNTYFHRSLPPAETCLTLELDVIEGFRQQGIAGLLLDKSCEAAISSGFSVIIEDGTLNGIGMKLYGSAHMTSKFHVTHFIGEQGIYLVGQRSASSTKLIYAKIDTLPSKIRTLTPSKPLPSPLIRTLKQPNHIQGYFECNPGHKILLQHPELNNDSNTSPHASLKTAWA